MPFQTTGIDHVHLMVSDIERAIERFTTILDCEHNIPLYIDSIQALNSMNSLGLDVFEPKAAEGIAGKQMARFGGPGLTTLSFGVEDIDAATSHIEGCDVRLMSRIGFPGVELQSQFHPRDCFGMVLELVQYVKGHEQVVAEIKAKQAKENDGRTGIPAKPGALTGSGIDHTHLRVGDLDAARRWFSELFVCEWDEVETGPDGPRATRSSIGVHLVEAAGESQGLGSVAFGVDDFAAAEALAAKLGLRRLELADHAPGESCLRFDPDDACGLPLELVPSP